MIPYLGCKQSFAGELLANIPAAENFYDLFGGGGSVTEAASKCQTDGILEPWKKWKHLHYNELNTGVYLLNKEVWEGRFDFGYVKAQVPTKERFRKERNNMTAWGAFVTYVWSFGNKGDGYFYSEKSNPETLGRNVHLERVNAIEKSPRLANIKMTNKDYRWVKIKPNSVVYCDIPYIDKRKYYGVKFDFNAFYAWAQNADFPVYFSGYDIVGYYKFTQVWEKLVTAKIKLNNNVTRTEKLFWNGRIL